MPALDPAAELAPRDIVARGVFAEIKGGARRVSRRAQDRKFVREVSDGCSAPARKPASIPPNSRSRSRPPRIITWAAFSPTPTARTSLDGVVGGGRSFLHRRAWRQPARFEFAAGSRGVRGADRRRHRCHHGRKQNGKSRRAAADEAFPFSRNAGRGKAASRNHDGGSRRDPYRRRSCARACRDRFDRGKREVEGFARHGDLGAADRRCRLRAHPRAAARISGWIFPRPIPRRQSAAISRWTKHGRLQSAPPRKRRDARKLAVPRRVPVAARG